MAGCHELPGTKKRGDLLSRRVVFGLAIGAAGLLSIPRRMFAQDTVATGIENPLSGETFVGVADDGVTHIAVVLLEVSGVREARFYACDGESRNVWLTDSAVEDITTITGEVASVSLELGPKVSGRVTFPDGVELTFTADPASGVAGLYEIGPVSDFLLTGTGTSGQAIQLQVAGGLEDGTRLLAGIIAAEGAAHPVALFASSDAAGELRIIASHQGTIVGGSRIVQGAATGAGFVKAAIPGSTGSLSWTDPGSQPWVDPDPEPWVDPEPQP
jgi:hypothetical protein